MHVELSQAAAARSNNSHNPPRYSGTSRMPHKLTVLSTPTLVADFEWLPKATAENFQLDRRWPRGIAPNSETKWRKLVFCAAARAASRHTLARLDFSPPCDA